MNLYESVKNNLKETDVASLYDKAISSTKYDEVEGIKNKIEEQLDYERRRNEVSATSKADLAYEDELQGYVYDLEERLKNLDECDKKIKESDEPEEDKKLPFDERVMRAYDNCNYSLRADMPTISDILDYLGMQDTGDNRNLVCNIIYKAGKDWQVECDKVDRKKELKESDDKRVDLFLRNDYGDWIDFLWYFPDTGQFCSTFEHVSHAEAWKRLNSPEVKKAVKDAWSDDTEKVYAEMINYLKNCEDLKESSELKESYDTINVVEDAISSIERLKSLIDDGTFNDLSTVSKELDLIVKNIKDNLNEAW